MSKRKALAARAAIIVLAGVAAVASELRAENSVTEPGMPWPISTEEVDWHKILGAVGAGQADTAAAAPASVTEPGMPWPVSMEPANWHLPIAAGGSSEQPAAVESVTAPAIAWPVSMEEANWHKILGAAGADAQAPAAASVTEPGMPWPVSMEPANWHSSAPAASASAASCQDDLRSAARAGIILFETASSSIDGASSTTLDKIAAVAKSCGGVKITVEGHTDSAGKPARNKRLSQRRADAVVSYLVKAGVSESILNAIGYGQDKPVASNDSEDGRAQNRRIEFTVN